MTNTGSGVSNAVKQQIIGSLIGTPAGRTKLATSMTQPLRLRRDYTAVGRKTFLVENLPDGANAYYDKDADVAAYVVGEEGENIVSMLKSRRIQIPLFEIACNPEIPLTQIKERRYDMIERAQDLARAQIQAAEDERVFAIMDAVATGGFDSIAGGANPDLPVIAPISIDILADAFAAIETQGNNVARIFMNARDYADLRKGGRDQYDQETQRDLIRSGLMATLWGASIIVSRLVPAGTVYITCDPDLFGRIAVRQELTVLSADDPKARTIGFSVFENLGIGATNPYGLVRLTITRG